MIRTSRLRKIALTAHVISTVGWLGAIAGFLALAIVGLFGKDPELVRSSYLLMASIGWYVLVPMCIASLVTGLIMSLGTQWGLIRHYWVVVKFVITVVAALILFMYTQTLDEITQLARNTSLSIEALRNPSPVVHSVAALLALLVNTALSIFKPRGLTAYGRMKLQQRDVRVEAPAVSVLTNATQDRVPATRTPRWLYIVGIHAVGLFLLFLLAHLTGTMPSH